MQDTPITRPTSAGALRLRHVVEQCQAASLQRGAAHPPGEDARVFEIGVGLLTLGAPLHQRGERLREVAGPRSVVMLQLWHPPSAYPSERVPHLVDGGGDRRHRGRHTGDLCVTQRHLMPSPFHTGARCDALAFPHRGSLEMSSV